MITLPGSYSITVLGSWLRVMFSDWKLVGQQVALLATVAVLLRATYRKYASPLRHYPGPLLASYSRLWQVFVTASGHAEQHYMNAHRKYGPIIRIGPNEVSLASANAAAELFKTGKGYTKPPFYTVFLPFEMKDIFTEIREPVHALKKRFVVPPYSMASVQKLKASIEPVMQNLFRKFEEFCSTQQTIDLCEWLHFLTFDVLGEFAFARSFGFLDEGNDISGVIAAISLNTYTSGIVGQVPLVEKLTRSNPLWRYIPKWLLRTEQAQLIPTMARQAVESHDGSRPCLLDSLLQVQSQNTDRFTMDDVMAISMGAIGAGSDSTSSTMNSFMWNLLNHPEVSEKLVAELDSANGMSDHIELHEAQSLSYFSACLKESMRLQPAVGFNIVRSTPASGAVLDKVTIPGNVEVAVNAWVTHRDETVFGPDSDKFIPDRWLVNNPEKLKVMERCMLQFGGGAHMCIGRHLALYEMNRLLPELFRRFIFERVNLAPLRTSTGFFYIQKGLEVRLRRRQN